MVRWSDRFYQSITQALPPSSVVKVNISELDRRLTKTPLIIIIQIKLRFAPASKQYSHKGRVVRCCVEGCFAGDSLVHEDALLTRPHPNTTLLKNNTATALPLAKRRKIMLSSEITTAYFHYGDIHTARV